MKHIGLNALFMLVISAVMVFGALAFVRAATFLPSQSGTLDKEKSNYFVQLLGTRPGWPENMTEEEERIMEEHFTYLKDLVDRKVVLMAGPCFDPVFGLVILQTDSEEKAIEIMENEPSVKGGVHTYQLQPMRVSLLAENETGNYLITDESNSILTKKVTVNASLEEVWEAWTTTDGVRTFFAPDANVELKIFGPYEIYFNPNGQHGFRGSEKCRILSFLPMRMLSFEWNAPTDFGELRNKRTRIVIMLEENRDHTVSVSLSHAGWGHGEDWEKVYDYFDNAWSYVLNNLQKRFTSGPIEWGK